MTAVYSSSTSPGKTLEPIIGSIPVALTTLDLIAIQYSDSYDRNVRGTELQQLRSTAMDAGARSGVTHEEMLAIARGASRRIAATQAEEQQELRRRGAPIIEATIREILGQPQSPLIEEVHTALTAAYPEIPQVDREALATMAHADAQRLRGIVP